MQWLLASLNFYNEFNNKEKQKILKSGTMRIFSDMNRQKHFLDFLSSIIPLVSLILILSICSNSNAQTRTVTRQPFRYEVYLQKNTFLVGELVDIGVSIINTSNVVQKSGYVNIKMFDEFGKALRSNYASGDWFSPEHIDLQPNDENYKVIQLNNGFGTQYSFADYNHFTIPGTYTIRVYFSTYDYTKRDSIEKVIKILEPGGEEAVVYKTYVEIAKRKPYNSLQQAASLESLLELHPNSTYAPPILDELSTTYKIWLKDKDKTKKTYIKIIETSPVSSVARGIIGSGIFEELIPSKAERLTLIKNLITKAKNSPMQKLLELKLKEEMDK